MVEFPFNTKTTQIIYQKLGDVSATADAFFQWKTLLGVATVVAAKSS